MTPTGRRSHRSLRRRGALAALAASVLVAAGCGGGGDSDETADGLRKLTLAAQGSFHTVYIAEDQGFFEDEGIKVERHIIGQPAAQFAAMTAGDVDINITSPSVLINQNRQGSERYVFIEHAVSTDWTLAAAPDSDVPAAAEAGFGATIEALKGKIIGIPAAGGLQDLILREVLQAGGLNPDSDVEIVVVQYGQTSITALQTGQVDAYTYSYDFAAPAIADAGAKPVLSSTNPGELPAELRVDEMFLAGYSAPVDRLEADPELYAAFVRAIQRAKEFAQDPANADELARIEAEGFEFSEAASQLYVEKGLPLVTGSLNCETVEVTVQQLIAFGAMQPPADACGDVYRQIG